MSDKINRKSGHLPRIFGVILVVLGAMDCMLAWRGAFHVNKFYIFLIGIGVLLFCFGAIRSHSAAKGV